MKYLILDDEQYDRHAKLMDTQMSELPEDLKTFIEQIGKQQSLTSDTIACAVADWIRGDTRLTKFTQGNSGGKTNK